MSNDNTLVFLQEGKMSLILDSYIDIFSSFDPRGYAERSLSDDFLEECKKIVLDKGSDLIELRLLIPEKFRNTHDEEVIKKRLHSYFMVQDHLQEKMRHEDMKNGWGFVLIGIVIGLGVSYILHMNAFAYMFSTFITVIGEPASWLLIWNGADKLLKYFWGEKDEEYQFAHSLSRAKIQFYGY